MIRPRLSRHLGLLAGLLTAAFTATACATPGPAAPATPSAAGGQVNPVIAWNRTLLEIQAIPGAQPGTVHPTRALAIMHAAIYDAVNAIDGHHRPYLVHVTAPGPASQEAAATAAADTTLLALYPAQKTLLDTRAASALAQIPDGPVKQAGIDLGRDVATRVLAARAHDHSEAPARAYAPGTAPGYYQPTPPKLAPPVFTGWAGVTPFTLTRPDQYRPPPPPALASTAYATAFNEVKTVGASTGSRRSDDQTQQGMFWSAPIQNYWNQIAQTVTEAQHSSVADTARTFALLNLGLADDVIGFYDAKYTYHLWRPITAIHNASTAANPATTPDPSWTPLTATAPDPSYPGAHSTISATAATILTALYGPAVHFSVTSPSLPGVTRGFASFTAASDEAGLSRIYAGQHTRIDHTAGQDLGTHIANHVLTTTAQ
jgi:hypothetical protein